MKWKWKRLAAFLLAAAMILRCREFRHLRWKRVRPPSIRACVSITRNIQRTADIRKEPKGQPVNMNILRIATPLWRSVSINMTKAVTLFWKAAYQKIRRPIEAEEAQPTACTHKCSEESGCITKELNCQYDSESTPITAKALMKNKRSPPGPMRGSLFYRSRTGNDRCIAGRNGYQ